MDNLSVFQLIQVKIPWNSDHNRSALHSDCCIAIDYMMWCQWGNKVINVLSKIRKGSRYDRSSRSYQLQIATEPILRLRSSLPLLVLPRSESVSHTWNKWLSSPILVFSKFLSLLDTITIVTVFATTLHVLSKSDSIEMTMSMLIDLKDYKLDW